MNTRLTIPHHPGHNGTKSVFLSALLEGRLPASSLVVARRICFPTDRRGLQRSPPPPPRPRVFCFKQDKLNVEAFSDPKVKGVTLYLSDFSRPVADKLMNGDMFSGAGPLPTSVKHLKRFFVSSARRYRCAKSKQQVVRDVRVFSCGLPVTHALAVSLRFGRWCRVLVCVSSGFW